MVQWIYLYSMGFIKQQTSLWGQKTPRIWILPGSPACALHHLCLLSWSWGVSHLTGPSNGPSKWRENQPENVVQPFQTGKHLEGRPTKMDMYIYIPPDWKYAVLENKRAVSILEKNTAKRPHSNLGKILELRMRPGLRLIFGSKSMVAHGTSILSLLKSGPARKPPHRFCSRVSFFTMIQTLKLNLGPFLLSKNIFWKTRQHSNFQSGGKIIYVYIYI